MFQPISSPSLVHGTRTALERYETCQSACNRGLMVRLDVEQLESTYVFVPLLIHGASTATITLSWIGQALSLPVVESNEVPGVSLTPSHRSLLLSLYAPWLFVPLLMTVDMAFRVQKLVNVGVQAEKAAKRQ
jgi:hypothetical protein